MTEPAPRRGEFTRDPDDTQAYPADGTPVEPTRYADPPRHSHEPTHVHDEVVAYRGGGGSPLGVVRQLVWVLFGILQAMLVIRIILLLLGANETNDIVAFVLGVTNPFVEPFRGMFQLDEVTGATGTVLDIAALVALVAWTLVEALILAIIGLVERGAESVA